MRVHSVSASQSDDQLRHLLLDMISSARPLATGRTAALVSRDWDSICQMAEQHRLGPILHHQSMAQGTNWNVPDEVKARWANAYRKSALRAMQLQQLLLRLDDLMRQASIHYAALKGAWLFHHAYPHPALRPMRDIDIVVLPKDALAVFGLLEANGFVCASGYAMPAGHEVEDQKHLPPLREVRSGIAVEVHVRLLEQGAADGQQGTIADTDAILSRTIRSKGVNYLTPTDTLLHLIVHAVYDHQLNNGPATLNDIALLIASAQIDWDRFWTMTETGGWAVGCDLLLAMVQHYHASETPKRNGLLLRISAEQVEGASLLTLQDFGQRGLVGLRAELAAAGGLSKRFTVLLRRAFPARNALAAFSGSASATRSVYLHYPKWLMARARQRLFARQSHTVNADIMRAERLKIWLLNN